MTVMRQLISRFGALSLAIAIAALFAPAAAQFNPLSVDLSITPESPEVGTIVSAEARVFGVDKDQVEFSWYLDGQLIREASGIGRNTYGFTVNISGEPIEVRVLATSESGTSVSAEKIIQPNAVALYWWTETSVPYWYRGKSLVTPSSVVTVIAIPTNQSFGDPNSLIYRWAVDESSQKNDSGYGRRTISFQTSFIASQDHFVGVRVETSGGATVGEANIRVANRPPEVYIYAVPPLTGVNFREVLKTFVAPSGEPYDFLVAPYFFNTLASRLTYRWTLNSKEIAGEFTKPWLFTLTSNSFTPSRDFISAAVENPDDIAARAGANVTIELR